MKTPLKTIVSYLKNLLLRLLHKKPKDKPRTFAIFLDYKNLEENIKKTARDKLENFSWLIEPILKEGKIIFAFVFIPTHYVGRAPVMQLSYLHHFIPVLCPRQTDGAVTKDADTVDAKIVTVAKGLIQHSDITDVVIVSGDSDFSELANFAHWQQKRVWTVSAIGAVSGKFLKMLKNGVVEKLDLVE
ncbi:MAG: NYN domain-containing protein [Candidatus Yanofskybacteria bacterium]|nr:NYN domain-containing protein [Candidatus Yanofskybacteria bacterium]